MASWRITFQDEDGDAPLDFHDILKVKEDVEVVKTELKLELCKVESDEDESCLGEAQSVEAEGTVEAEDADEAEPCEHNEPAPAVTVTARWDEKMDSLAVTSRSPPSTQAPLTPAAVGLGEPPVLLPYDIVVEGGLDFAMEDHVFHLADEHQLFQQAEKVAAEQPQQQHHPQRGGAAQRGRARTRGARGQGPRGGSQWVRGDRLVEVNVDDDDVPAELREMVMRVVRAREAARVRVTDRARRVKQENEDEWIDADDGEVESFFAAEGTSGHFEWSPMGDYQGEREQFLPQRTGAVVASENAYGAFRQYWDEGIMSHIVTATNQYAARLASSSASFANDWYDTNIHEVYVLFSFWMMLGVIRMPSIKSCFALQPLLQTNIFRELFSQTRYDNLCRAFHLNDNSSRPTDSTDLLYSLGPNLDHLNARFQQAYIPSQNICIDESLSIRQYIKTKAAQYGVNTYELCESSTGYIWSFFVHVGTGTSYSPVLTSTVLKSTTTVLKLIRPLLDKGYTLFMDNWFNSPLLARFLKRRKTDCVGTLRANRSNVPPLMSLCDLKDGQYVARHSGDVVVLAYQDRKCKVVTISTYHGDSQGQMEANPHRPALYKPQVVLDYNKSMAGVGSKDQIMLEPYLQKGKRGDKWNIRFFKHLLNCSILNARILLHSSTATPKEDMVFRLELVDQILRHHLQHVPRKVAPTHPGSSSLGNPQPQVQHIPLQTDELTAERRKRRRCAWCSQHKLVQATIYVCSVCDAYALDNASSSTI